MTNLTGKVAVITGGSSGIGFTAAKRLIGAGAQVVIAGRDQAKLDRAVSELGSASSSVVCDVMKMSDVQRLGDQVRQLHQAVHVVFANAGISEPAPFMEATEDHFDRHVATNLKGVFFTIQSLARLMGRGSSVIINSSATARRPVPAGSVYAATKAAVASLAQSLSQELLERGVRVNAILPGAIDTPIYTKMGIPGDRLAETLAGFEQLIPVKRFGTPEEVAALVAFLASDESAYIVGETIVVGGGYGTL